MKLTVAAFALLFSTTLGCAPVLRDAPSTAVGLDAAALVASGEGFEDARDYRSAEEAYSAALEAGADVDSTLPKLVRVSVACKDFLPALHHAKAALARRPRDPNLKFTVGALYAVMGARELAREHLESAAAVRALDGDLQYSVAAIFRDDLGNRGLARRYFEAYLKVQPHGPHASEARASLLASNPE
jgi:tetratricopeptide (TPR) repeat protein